MYTTDGVVAQLREVPIQNPYYKRCHLAAFEIERLQKSERELMLNNQSLMTKVEMLSAEVRAARGE